MKKSQKIFLYDYFFTTVNPIWDGQAGNVLLIYGCEL